MYPNFYPGHQWHHPLPNHWNNQQWNHHWEQYWHPYYQHWIELKDHGQKPFIFNIEHVTRQNNTFRTALWTGKHLQLTLMSIHVGEDIGLEVHPTTDQFLRIEEGQGFVQMGPNKDRLDIQEYVNENDAILVPAGTWHNVINTGNIPLKLYSIYGPPAHPFGTVHQTKAMAIAAEHNH